MTERTAGRRIAPAVAALAFLTAASTAGWAAPSASPIAPHKATYQLSLSQTRAGSPVSDVKGRMSFAWQDACDGWTVEQRFEVSFTYAEGQTVDMATSYVTWEAKNGESYRFNVRKMVNGKLDEELRGDATMKDGKGTARYVKPEEKTVPLKPGTMFPSAHTILMLKLAREGETFLSRPIFDGSEAGGATAVSAVMGGKRKLEKLETASAELKQTDAWPVHLAFFPVDEQEYLADYETSLSLLGNGIVQSMLIDYGDFKVDAKLQSLEAAPKPPC